MRTNSVESRTYQPTQSVFDDPGNLIEPADFNDLPPLAQQLGFTDIGEIPTPRSRWKIFNRSGYPEANFADQLSFADKPSMATYSTLAVYGDPDLTHAVMRTSEKKYPLEEFRKDLAAFTKYYVERPQIWGFPSRQLTRMEHVFTAFVAGTIIGIIGDYNLAVIPNEFIINPGLTLGGAAAASLQAALWQLAERRARHSISNSEQYSAGEQAANILREELNKRHHLTMVKNAIRLTAPDFSC